MRASWTVSGLVMGIACWGQAPFQAPWEGVPEAYRKLPVGRLEVPKDVGAWKKQREKVKATVVGSLGERPARPAPVKVQTVSTVRKDGYTVEKFLFHNGVDSEVPGYLAIPAKREGRRPAVLAMHGHGSSKENILGVDASSQDVAGLLVRRGYVVMAIDNYFNGERKGKGPAGDREVMARNSDQEMSLFKLNLWLGRTLWGMMCGTSRLRSITWRRGRRWIRSGSGWRG